MQTHKSENQKIFPTVLSSPDAIISINYITVYEIEVASYEPYCSFANGPD